MIRKVCLVLAAVGLSHILCADVQITDVKATPISPWAVIIDYNVNGDLSGYNDYCYVTFSLIASNIVTQQSFMARKGTVKGDIQLSLGKHRIRWDFPEDEVRMDFSDVKMEIKYEILFPYCIVDLSEGRNAESYPVTYLSSIPSGKWDDEYKKNKIVLRLIEPGTFIMGDDFSDELNPPHQVVLTDFFYIGVFEVTENQYSLVNYSKENGMIPKVNTSWNALRGGNWPQPSYCSKFSFIGTLQSKTGIKFDLPTEAQWEYACRAGTRTAYNYGDKESTLYMWWHDNSDWEVQIVGTKRSNAWGLYDMHGNAQEWCLDWYGSLREAINPKGAETGDYRVLRGGGAYHGKSMNSYSSGELCTSSARSRCLPGGEETTDDNGFRIVRTLEGKYTEIVRGVMR